jgi:hypothetical protein
LTRLQLVNSHITSSGALAWAWAIQYLPLLQRLDYVYQYTSCAPIGAQALADAVLRTPGITQLCLNDTRHDGPAGGAIERLAQASGLQKLDLICGLVSGPLSVVTPCYQEGVLAGLTRLTQLTSLAIGGCSLPEGHAIGTLLASLTALRDLCIFQVPVGLECALALAEAMRALACLTRLRVCSKDLDVQAFAIVAPALATCLQLRCLSLSSDAGMLGEGSCGSMHTMLARLTRLQALDLDDTGLRADTVAAVAEAAERGSLTSLTRIRLSRNLLGEGGPAALATLLQAGERLCEVEMGSMGLSHAGLRLLAKPLAALQELRLVDLVGNNDLGDEAERVLLNAFGSKRLGLRSRDSRESTSRCGSRSVEVFLKSRS